jgi:hypothetical protein
MVPEFLKDRVRQSTRALIHRPLIEFGKRFGRQVRIGGGREGAMEFSGALPNQARGRKIGAKPLGGYGCQFPLACF